MWHSIGVKSMDFGAKTARDQFLLLTLTSWASLRSYLSSPSLGFLMHKVGTVLAYRVTPYSWVSRVCPTQSKQPKRAREVGIPAQGALT